MARPLRIEYNDDIAHFTCRGDEKDGILYTAKTGETILSILQESIEKHKEELHDCDIGISHSVHSMKQEGASCEWQ